ncbi:UNVERIFIED_ORG: glycosyltransferase family 1 protein [Bacillus sp. AZ43]
MDVLFVNWRDSTHPEGGGSERYVHRMAEGLAAAGLRVSMFCAAHDRAPAEEIVGGVRVVRRGGRLTVYPQALLHVMRTRPRLVVDVQNGLPFGSPLVTRRPVVNLVHHVHREQWPIVFGRVGGAIGWWLESVVAPRLYRRSRYVTVSTATADELAGLGVDRERISVVRNGVEPAPRVAVLRSAEPRLVVLGRLVPHKRVEHALEVVARLRDRWPGLRLSVVGEGWWDEELRARAAALRVTDIVDFTGHVDEQTKHEELARSWVHLCPSVKEGWGLVVTEAGSHRVPTVGYRSAGGLRESVLDGRTGVLVDDLDELTAAVDGLLHDDDRRLAMGEAAARHAASFSWGASIRAFAAVLASAVRPDVPAAPGSAPVAVVQDVDRLVALLLDGVVGVERGLDAGDRSDAERGASAEGDEHGDQGLHSGTRFRGVRRRTVTLEGNRVIHNTDSTTIPSQQA